MAEIVRYGRTFFINDSLREGVDFVIELQDGQPVKRDLPSAKADADTLAAFKKTFASAVTPMSSHEHGQGGLNHAGELGLGAKDVTAPNAGQVERSTHRIPSSTGHGHEGLQPW